MIARRCLGGMLGGALLLVSAACGGSTVEESQERLEKLELPEGYTVVEDAQEPSHSATEQDYVFRQYEAPQNADICGDMEQAFKQWVDSPVKRYDDLTGCDVTTGEPGGVQIRMSASPANSRTFTVALYVRKDDWF